MKQRIYKCFECKQLIDNETPIEAQTYKNGEPLFLKSGKAKCSRYHNHCYEVVLKRKKEQKHFGELCDYLLNTYYEKSLPESIYPKLRDLGKCYSYKIILNCYKSIEENLLPYISRITFNSAYAKMKYLIVAVSNNIDFFYSRNKEELQMIESSKESEVIHLDSDKFTEVKSENLFDIFD